MTSYPFSSRFHSTAYRFPNEILILAITIIVVLLLIALTVPATVCLSVILVVGMFIFSYFYSRSQHQVLLRQGQAVNQQYLPELSSLIGKTANRLGVEPVEVFVVPNRQLNAYTFGLSTPKIIVLNSSLFDVMDQDEIQFVVGHEMGHVQLGHTWLNSLVGGMAGIPSPPEIGLLLVLIFRWWNRACEYSADRAGMLAVGNPRKAVSALVKLYTGLHNLSPASLERALVSIEAQDDSLLNNLNELLATHPMIVRRVEQLLRYTNTAEYRRLQTLINQNG